MKIEQCIDFNKPMENVDNPEWERVDLYHATVDKHGVCKYGLQPACNAPRCGLGTGVQTRKLVSFTLQQKIAKRIAKDLRTMVNIANGSITPDNICQTLDQIDVNPRIANKGACDVWQRFTRPPSDSSFSSSQQEVNEAWEMLKQGWVEVDYRMFGHESYTKIPLHQWKDDYDTFKLPIYYQLRDKGNTTHAASVYVKGTPIQQRQALYDLWRKYLRDRETDLDIPNPVFTEDVSMNLLKDLSARDVGIVKVDAMIPNDHLRRYMRDEDDQLHMGFQYFGADIHNDEIRLDRKYFTQLQIIE